ncbi:inovirus-type Gp2 protein [Vibrio sp. SA48]
MVAERIQQGFSTKKAISLMSSSLNKTDEAVRKDYERWCKDKVEISGCVPFPELVERRNGKIFHPKILPYFDLHMNAYTDDNRMISQFQRKLFSRIKSKYQVKDIGFAWGREMEKAKQQHYHYALFLDGKQIRHPGTLLDIIQEKWMFAGGGHAHTPKNSYYNVEKNDFQKKQDVIYRLSYQAKERGKWYRAIQAKNYGTNRIKP